MIVWGINALNHGHSIAVFKHDRFVSLEVGTSDELSSESIRRSLNWDAPDYIFWYERPWLKKTRQMFAGQWSRALDLSVLPSNYMNRCRLGYAPITYTSHHASHAAAGYYTSPFEEATVIVLDAIGEWESASIWKGRGDKLTKIWHRSYPNSLGLFYSAFTDLIDLTPVQDEFLLQQMSTKGDPERYYKDIKDYFTGPVMLTANFHKGVPYWPHEISTDQDRYDIAAAVQKVFEEQVAEVIKTAYLLTRDTNLVYMGGCAMNSAANKKVVEPHWDRIWSLPQPGDPSSAIGAVLYHTKQHIKWEHGLAKHITIK